jgi:hypothetical protein
MSNSPVIVGVNQTGVDTPGFASCLTRIAGTPKL